MRFGLGDDSGRANQLVLLVLLVLHRGTGTNDDSRISRLSQIGSSVLLLASLLIALHDVLAGCVAVRIAVRVD